MAAKRVVKSPEPSIATTSYGYATCAAAARAALAVLFSPTALSACPCAHDVIVRPSACAAAGWHDRGSIDLVALRAEKRALRKTLRSFETAFSEKHGRVVQTPADMQPRLQEYQRYKVRASAPTHAR